MEDTTRLASTEILLQNRVDEDVQRMLRPLNLIQALFLSSKYNIRDNFITPKNIRYSIGSIILTLILGLIYLYEMIIAKSFSIELYGSYILYVITIFFFVLYSIGFIAIFVVNVRCSHSNVTLVLRLQDINRYFNLNRSERQFYIIGNWVSVISAMLVNLLMFIIYFSMHNYFSVIEFICYFLFISFDINMIYSIRIIYLLRKYLYIWIRSIQGNNHIREIEYYRRTYDVYENILEAYNLYKKVFQVLVLYHTTDTFFRGLCYVKVMIDLFKASFLEHKHKYLIMGLLTCMCLGKNIILQILQSVECGKFYFTIREAECASLMYVENERFSDDQKHIFINVLRLNRSSFRKMSACGLFDIDVILPWQLLSVLTNYIIVMLQFAFL